MSYPAKLNEELILTTAIELVDSNLLDRLTLGAIALELGVRKQSLYRYFWSIEALESAAACRASGILLRAIPHSPQRLSRDSRYVVTREMVEDFARHYLSFARDRPGLYTLITAPPRSDTAQRYPSSPRLILRRFSLLMDRYLNRSAAHTPTGDRAARALWALLHGHAVLERDFLTASVSRRPTGSLPDGLTAWLDGLEHSVEQEASAQEGRIQSASDR